MSYIPREGSYPQLAIAHLETLPPGTTLTTQVLADAIGADYANMRSLMFVAVRHRLLISERWAEDRRIVTYRLPTADERGQPPATPPAARDADPEDTAPLNPAPTAVNVTQASVFNAAQAGQLARIALDVVHERKPRSAAQQPAPATLAWQHAGGAMPQPSAAPTPDDRPTDQAEPHVSFGLFDDGTLIIQQGDDMRAIPALAVRRLAQLLRGLPSPTATMTQPL